MKSMSALLDSMEVDHKRQDERAIRNHFASIGNTVADLDRVHSVPDENVGHCGQNKKSHTGEGEVELSYCDQIWCRSKTQ
jgi:hypothetical protein